MKTSSQYLYNSTVGWSLFSDVHILFLKPKKAAVPLSPLEEFVKVSGDVKTAGREEKYKTHSPAENEEESEAVKLIQFISEPLFLKALSNLSSRSQEGVSFCDLPPAWKFVIRAADPVRYHSFDELGRSPVSTSFLSAMVVMSKIEITKIETGSTNHVFRLYHPQLKKKHLLLRIYGSCDGVADRDREVLTMKYMSNCGLGPQLLCRWVWGRVEEFIEDAETCTTSMIISSPTLQRKIFEQIKEMHQLPFSEFLPQAINKYSPKGATCAKTAEEYFDKCWQSTYQLLRSTNRTDPYYFYRLDVKVMEDCCPTFLERTSLRFLRHLIGSVTDKYKTAFETFFLDEILWLQKNLRKCNVPIVFSHNDLNAGNILVKKESILTSSDKSGLYFVDYEYSDANYRAFDLGNGMCELDYSYESHFPGGFCKPLYITAQSDNLPREFPRFPQTLYECWKLGGEESKIEKKGLFFPLAFSCLSAIKNYFFAKEDCDLKEHHLREVFLGMLSSHLIYSMWSFMMGTKQSFAEKNSNSMIKSGLDFMDYGECRIKEYLLLKNWLIETNEFSFIFF